MRKPLDMMVSFASSHQFLYFGGTERLKERIPLTTKANCGLPVWGNYKKLGPLGLDSCTIVLSCCAKHPQQKPPEENGVHLDHKPRL